MEMMKLRLETSQNIKIMKKKVKILKDRKTILICKMKMNRSKNTWVTPPDTTIHMKMSLIEID